MGICGSSHGKGRVFPQSNKGKMGLRSGQTIASMSVLRQQSITKTHKQRMQQIQDIEIDLQEIQLVKWIDPTKHLQSQLAKNTQFETYKVSNMYRVTGTQLTAELLDANGTQYILKRAVYNSFDKASRFISYLYNLNKVDTTKLLTFKLLTINELKCDHCEQLVEGKLFAVDRLLLKSGLTLEEYKQTKGSVFNSIYPLLHVLEYLSEGISALHHEGFAYRFVRPENILVRNKDIDNSLPSVVLNNPSMKYSDSELQLIKNTVETPQDYFIYDCILLGVLLMYLMSNDNTFDQLLIKRIEEEDWRQVVESRKQHLQQQFKDDTPQILIQLIDTLTVFEKPLISRSKDIHTLIKGIKDKGLQTAFKNDSLGAFLQYHQGKQIPGVSPWMYFAKSNQIHLYNLETEKFHYLKVFRKKKRYFLQSSVTYHPLEDKFFFFSSTPSSLLLRIYDESHQKNVLSQRREVELFRNLRTLNFEDPQILYVERSERESLLYIMNGLQQTDENTNDVYYGSYVIYFGEQLLTEEEEKERNKDEFDYDTMNLKKIIKIYEGPKNYQWRRYSYHFYDPHNHYIYCIPDFNNIFQNGIRYSFFDTIADKGHFKEGILRFACSGDQIYKQFCDLNMKIRKIVFCVEAQHGVYLMHAAKNIFILDFNFKCFYSLASLSQLQNYERNYKQNQFQYTNVYQTLNQKFELKYHLNLNDGRSISFQNGYLHCIAQKEIETVHCIFQLQPHQGSLLLLNCYSLYSNKDLLTLIPRTLDHVVDVNQTILNEQILVKKVYKTINQYRCFEIIHQFSNQVYLNAENDQKQHFYLHQVKADSLRQISLLFASFTKKIKSQLLLNPIDYFATLEQNDYYMNYVNEEIAYTMEKEIEDRRHNASPFQEKELALLIKIIFKGLDAIRASSLEHGNLSTHSLCFTKKGMIKIAGWYVTNRPDYVSDFLDAACLIYCLASLTPAADIENFSSKVIEMNSHKIKRYPGLSEFLIFTIKTHSTQSFATLLNKALNISKVLMIKSIDFSELKSNSQSVIWIGYGSNYIIVTPLESKIFQRLQVFNNNKQPFKFSKHCMFTYDFKNTLYVTGSIKEDLKTQHFYELTFNDDQQQYLVLKKHQDIPFSVLSPTLVYGDGIVYSIGGYEVQPDLSKNITDKVFYFNCKYKQCYCLNGRRACSKLPITLVGCTALYSEQNRKLYLLGGISNEIDLTSEKLIYLCYDINKDFWEFNIDLSFRSPFQNSRFTKPIVDLINDKFFISYQKQNDGSYFIEIFELVKGGVSLKFSIQNNQERFAAEKLKRDNDRDMFMDDLTLETKRTLQDDLSMAVLKDTIYVMDEETKNLNMFKLSDIFNPQFDSIPCSIRSAAEFKQQNSFTEDERSLQSAIK